MSVPYTLEEQVPLPRPRRAAARVAVAVARVISMLPPSRIQRVLHVLRRGAAPATAQEALSARTAVVAVSVRCAGEGCLQRSLAAVLLCRMKGKWPTWCTGVRVHPFGAHAWVEAEGQPVGETWPVGYYQSIMTVASRR